MKNNKKVKKEKASVKETDSNTTPKQKCETAHAGQAGYCQDDGTWVPAV